MKKITFLLTILFLCATFLSAQTTIWIEDFNTQADDGVGATGPIPIGTNTGVTAPASGKWTVDVTNCDLSATTDWFRVEGSRLEARDVDGTQQAGGTGDGALWTSESIGISGYTNVSVYVDFAQSGTFEDQDFIKASYQIDGGTITQFAFFNGTFTDQTVSITGLLGTSIIIYLEADNNAGTEYLQFDNIIVQGLAPGGVDNPTSFEAATAGADQIDLSWAQNTNTDDVMVAYTLDGTFGSPVDATSYAIDDVIPGGGTVIYNGSAISTNHAGLTANTVYYYKAWSVDGTVTYSSGVTTDNTTLASEPTTDATALSTTADGPTAITVNWTDASDATNYLIKGSDGGYGSITDPVDGITEADGALVQNVAAGTGTFQFTGLTPGTTYYFQIYPYNGENSAVNYKTDSPAQTSETTDSFTAPNAWINEFHYDNESTDVGEFVEIVIENADNYTLSDFQVNLYNGGNNLSYDSETLDNFTVGITPEGNFTFYIWEPSSIQNGGPDGLALSYQGTLISGQFLSYEGTFTAADGPADGVLSTDIGVIENGTEPLGQSLQLKGGGTSYEMFLWVDPAAETPGALNNTQFFGDYTTWSGATNNDWATETNWLNGIPDVTLGAVIPQDLTNYPTLGAAGTCLNLYLESNASLVGVDNLTVSGTATIEQTIDQYTSASDGFHFLSSPVASQTIAGSDFEPVEFVDDFYSWDETTAMWLNWYDGLTDSEFIVGKGYLVAYSPGNDAAFTGTLNNSAEVESLSFTSGQGEGWNLLGNPFPSAIDWDLLTKSADVNGTVYVIKGSDNTYDTWNGTTGDLTDGEIPKNNGFFVKAESTGASVTIETTDQVHGSTPFLKKGNGQNPESTLKVSISNEIYVNNTYVQFREDATADFDAAIDGYKLFGSSDSPQLFTKLSGTEYSINCLPYSIEGTQLPLGFKNSKASEYTISVSGIDSFLDGDFEVFLEDTETNDLVNLEEENYTFTAEGVNYDERFILHFSAITAVGEKALADDVQIYANGNSVYFRFATIPQGDAQVSVFSTIGQQVYSGEVGQSTMSSVKLNEKPGIYIVRLQSEKGTTTQKVMIK